MVIPNSVTSIGGYAFDFCTGLTDLTIGNSVTLIDEFAFSYCTGLTSITLPNSVITIGEFAFEECHGLESVIIPNSVTSIGNYAFYDCGGLLDVYSLIADPTAIEMGYSAFQVYPEEYDGRVLHVPSGTSMAYQQDENWSGYFGSIVEMSALTGDIDGDLMITIGDVTSLIDIVLNHHTSVGNYPQADVDGDLAITIGDVTALIDYMLNQ